MSDRYIGARYVAKAYVNSLDPTSSDWEAGVNYEPLTMVTESGSIYFSKKPVPSTVGAPASNPEYWCLWSTYAGDIAQLKQDVLDIQDAIDNGLVYVDRIQLLITYDGVKTISQGLDELRGLFDNLITSYGSEYRFKLVSSIYETGVFVASSLITPGYLLDNSFTGDIYVFMDEMHYFNKFASYSILGSSSVAKVFDASASTISDASGWVPTSGAKADLWVEIYKII